MRAASSATLSQAARDRSADYESDSDVMMGLPQQVAGPSRGCRSDRQVKEKQRSVVVLGHSFITRLDQYVKNPGSDFKLDIFNINLIGVPGATVQRLRCHSQT